MIEKKDFPFLGEIKLGAAGASGEGTFQGMLSTYGNLDHGGDIVEPGAFTKTLQENKGEVPMLWQHQSDRPIGKMKVISDTAAGLVVQGVLDLGVQQAREAYSGLRAGYLKGLSIGYRAVKKEVRGGVRYLKEIALFEGSVVTFPMNPAAVVDRVKHSGISATLEGCRAIAIRMEAARLADEMKERSATIQAMRNSIAARGWR